MAQAQPAPTFWIELNERDVRRIARGDVPASVIASMESFKAWLKGPRQGLAHDRAARPKKKRA